MLPEIRQAELDSGMRSIRTLAPFLPAFCLAFAINAAVRGADSGPPVGAVPPVPTSKPAGYYRMPALGSGFIVFVSEGDLWKVPTTGGVATRLTSHPGDEFAPSISPDGNTVAFIGQYEGPAEVYTMSLNGGLPKRLTYDASRQRVQGWTADGRIVSTTDKFSTLPCEQLTLIDPKTGARTLAPLAQASDGSFDPSVANADDSTLAFVRIPFNGSFTKRYKGGTIQQVWRFKKGAEAVNLTGDYAGTSKRPMWWKGRIYFLTDRDNHMNVWSMTPEGKDLKQHTHHVGLDIQDMSLRDGKIAYQLGADLWLLDLANDKTAMVPITLETDLDQLRERWVEKPADYITASSLSPDGEKVAFTARGRIFVVPAKQGRTVDVDRDDTVRHRGATFIKDSDQLIALSDKSGEVEVWSMPANGVGAATQLTKDATVLQWGAFPSPDGKFIAHHNKNQELWIFDTEAKTDTKIDTSNIDDFADFTWSGDSKWLAYGAQADNNFPIIKIWSVDSKQVTVVTTDRYASYSPAWSADGKWLWFLSDRTLRTVVNSPWGANQPDPFLDQTTKIYALALKPGERFPFAPKDELQTAKEKAEKAEKEKKAKEAKDKPATDADKKVDEKKDDAPAVNTDEKKSDDAKADDKKPDDKKGDEKKDDKKDEKPKKVEIELAGLMERLYEVPIKANNYGSLTANDKALFFTNRPTDFEPKASLEALEIKNDPIETKTVTGDVTGYELSQDGKKLLIRKKDSFYIVDAAAAPVTDLDKKAVSLSGISLSLIPAMQFRQMFIEAWRLMRDYYYDPNMHGVDWRAMLDKYLPLVDRVTSRAELNNVMSQMVGELSTLHHFVNGGDLRDPPDNIAVASLGGVLQRDEAAGGYRITRIYQSEADDPERISPLAKPAVAAKVGDVIESIDGVPTLSAADASVLLRQKVGKQVLLHIKPANADKSGFDAGRDAIAIPISQGSENDLRYTDWELSRRKLVDEWSGGKIGYVHMRAMGQGDYTNWVKGFYPIFNREGLIMDVRHNRGGNIDSWVLSKLLRKAWAFWTPRVGNPPSWNMQYAFRGPMVALCNERTSSDGETFSEGFRRLGLGKVIGTRTWGGGIWLSSSNTLVDKGIASASEFAVYGLDGRWMVEGEGVTPDIIVDNMPNATFNGEDAQLKAAVDLLLKQIAENPVKPNTPPARPNKSTPDNAKK
ncbi:MAG: PDZ domain-containing protein [Planctomycetes bacterium]|nr:PDZ domain-containing protein [Planctomycetota bacterium]